MTASSVTSPNASVSAPSSSVPSASSVSSPSSSSSSAVSNVSPPVSSVKPVGSSTVKPFGNYDSSGTCVESSSTECKTSKDLSDEADRLEEQARKAAGDAERERARLEAARIRAQLDIREAVGNDRTADSYVSRIEKSALYNSLKDNPVGKTMFWLGISSKLDGRGWNEVFGSPRAFVEGVVRASETLEFKGRDSNGRMIFAPVTPSGNDPNPIPPSSVAIGGLLPQVPNTVVRGNPLAIGVGILLGGVAISPDMSGYLIEGIFNGGGQIYQSGIDMFTGLIDAAKASRDDPNSQLGTNKKQNAKVKRIADAEGLSPAQADLLHRSLPDDTDATDEEIRDLARQIAKNFTGTSKGDRKRENTRRNGK